MVEAGEGRGEAVEVGSARATVIRPVSVWSTWISYPSFKGSFTVKVMSYPMLRR